MERINTTNKEIDLFGAGKHGFRDGEPGTGVFATFLSAAWFNAIQEEIANVVESTGAALNPASRTQLLTAINAIIATAAGLPTNGSGEMTGDVVIANNKGIKIKNSAANALYALLRTAADVLQIGGVSMNNTEIVIGSSVKATFDNAGKMGLGRVADTELFEVGGSARVISGTCDGRLRPNGASSQVEVGAFSNHDLALITNNSVRARITAAGIFSANAAESKAANGYVRLPSGIYIQWGSANVNTTGVGITFPVAFPTACVAVVNTCNNQTNPPAAMASAVSTTGFTATTSAGTPSIFWIAIGY